MRCNFVHVVEPDPAVAETATAAIRPTGRQVRVYPDFDTFLATSALSDTGCVLLDLDFQIEGAASVGDRLMARGIGWPMIFVTNSSDVRRAVRAMREGAADVLAKPYTAAELIETLDNCETRWRPLPPRATDGLTLGALTPRERHVLDGLVQGSSHKEIGRRLGISPRTVEMHRARLKSKLGARSLPELVRLAGRYGDSPISTPP